jgi:seryl-tRNA synthetase
LQSDELLAQRNAVSKSIGALMAQGSKDEAETQKAVVSTLKEKIDLLAVELATTYTPSLCARNSLRQL